jgi:hypothetical protein
LGERVSKKINDSLSESVLRFYILPARQAPEIILNESSKNTENAPQKNKKVFSVNQSGLFGF